MGVGEERRIGVAVLAGSSGRVDVERARLLARHGALALALRWLGGEGQPPGICEVPLETFGAAVDWLVEGLGTPAPVAPTENLVVGGVYRYVRNPMYLAVTSTIVGQALLLGRPVLLAYAVVFFAVVATFVHWYEEPALSRTFGEEYEVYRGAVPAWRPRRTPWDKPPRD